jgi:hypothetical protein
MKDMTQEDAYYLGFLYVIITSLLPLGWLFCVNAPSIGLASLATIQIALVVVISISAYRFVNWTSRDSVLAGITASAGYFATCFLTNWIGAHLRW